MLLGVNLPEVVVVTGRQLGPTWRKGMSTMVERTPSKYKGTTTLLKIISTMELFYISSCFPGTISQLHRLREASQRFLRAVPS